MYLIVGIGVASIAVKHDPLLDDIERLCFILFWPMAVMFVIAAIVWTLFADGLLRLLKFVVRDR